MRYTWRHTPSGLLLVDFGAGWEVPTLDLREPWTREAWKRTRAWASVARSVKPSGMPLHWILGTVFKESLGRERAVAPDGGLGLMQLTDGDALGPLTMDQALDGRLNLSRGSAWWFSKCVRHQRPLDLPKAVSWFNRGGGPPPAGNPPWEPHPNPFSPWGLKHKLPTQPDTDHIEDVVRASNTAHREGLWTWPGVSRGTAPLLLFGAAAAAVYLGTK